jgi:hypothetical protein
MTCLKPIIIGRKIRQLTPKNSLSGRVLASLSHSIYLSTHDNIVFWIGDETVPLHQRCIQLSEVDFRSIPIIEKQPFSFNSICLQLDPNVSIDISLSRIWIPPSLDSHSLIPFSELENRIDITYEILSSYYPRKGLGQLLPLINNDHHRDPFDIKTLSDPFLKTISLIIKDILEAINHNNKKYFLSRVKKLIGLGSGLTPSGDDFLGGLYFVWIKLHQLFPKQIPIINFEKESTENIQQHTNLISATILNDLIQGEGVEPLHDLFNEILSSNADFGIKTHIEKLIKIGSSTGWDLLTGFIAGLYSLL